MELGYQTNFRCMNAVHWRYVLHGIDTWVYLAVEISEGTVIFSLWIQSIRIHKHILKSTISRSWFFAL